jgi:hypothetical protein
MYPNRHEADFQVRNGDDRVIDDRAGSRRADAEGRSQNERKAVGGRISGGLRHVAASGAEDAAVDVVVLRFDGGMAGGAGHAERFRIGAGPGRSHDAIELQIDFTWLV